MKKKKTISKEHKIQLYVPLNNSTQNIIETNGHHLLSTATTLSNDNTDVQSNPLTYQVTDFTLATKVA